VPVTGERPGDRALLLAAIERSGLCPPSTAAYAVGAVVVSADGLTRDAGHSREVHPQDHAEEVALARLAARAEVAGGTLYTSMEPCSTRRSRLRSCTELAIDMKVARVVFALREPPLLADCKGAALLAAAGVEVVEMAELAGAVRAVNAHLLGPR
jgi:diaminohydroxyphosphoribosylaminopyrimidine deaminase/5-amino-6-(5-phosphoribosylamino)uracil reductase